MAGAEVGRLADRTGRGDLGRVVGGLDRARVGPLRHRDLRWRGVTTVAGRELPVGQRSDAVQVPPVLQPAGEAARAAGVAGLGVELRERRLDAGDVAAVAVEE